MFPSLLQYPIVLRKQFVFIVLYFANNTKTKKKQTKFVVSKEDIEVCSFVA